MKGSQNSLLSGKNGAKANYMKWYQILEEMTTRNIKADAL